MTLTDNEKCDRWETGKQIFSSALSLSQNTTVRVKLSVVSWYCLCRKGYGEEGCQLNVLPSPQIFFFRVCYNCFETEQKVFLASFNLEIPSRSTSFSGERSSVTVEIVDKKRMCLWPLLGLERGQGSNWGLLVGLVTQLLITLCRNYPDNWHLSRVQGVTRSGL